MGVAAQVAARGLRRYGQALLPAMPASPVVHGSGEQPTGIPQVELYIGGWLDVTALGLVRYQQQIKVTRGQPDENQRTNPATASFRLANLDGRFNPRNPLSPYYGLIDKNTPCRISVQSGNSKSYRFWGEISSWPQDWDPTGNDAWVDVQAAGILRRLGTGNPPIRSAMFMYWVYAAATNYFNQPAQPVTAYWPCEDLTGATSLASGIGGTPMTIYGTPNLASNTAFVISQGLPVLNGATFRGIVPAYTPSVPASMVGISSSELMVEFLLDVPSSGDTSGVVVASVTTNGSATTWEIVYTNSGGGTLQLRAKDINGNVLATSPASNPVNGIPSIVAIVIDQFGANANGSCRLSAASGTGGLQYVSTGNIAGTFGLARSVVINPAGAAGLSQTALGQVAVTTWDDSGAAALAGLPGETAAARIQRLCGYANIAFELTGNASDTVLMGQQDPGTTLTLIQECVDADGGILFELTDQLGLGYRTRASMTNQTAVLALDYSQAHLSDVPTPVDDDQYTRNDVTVTRLNGSLTRAIQNTGPLNIQTPPTGVGRYDTSVTLNVQTDAQTADEAGWRLHLGTVAEPRYPDVGVQLARAEITSSPVLRPNALAVKPGDRITVANPPSWLPPDPISALVQGYTETFDQFLHHIQWNTRPESPFRVAVCDDPVFGRADTDGSTLSAPLTGGLNASPLFTSGDVSHWTGVHCAVTGAGPAPSTVALPAGAPQSWGALLTPDGTASANAAKESSGFFPAAPNQAYQVSAYVYAPNGYSQVTLGFDWTDASHNVLSNSFSTTAVPAGVWTPLNTSQAADPAAVYGYPRIGQGGTPAATDLLFFAVVVVWQGQVLVATSNPGSPLWTTSAGDFPFDVAMGGERLTVTGVTGGSSPQTFNVARSVNGVVKAQAVNTGVQLWQPAIATM